MKNESVKTGVNVCNRTIRNLANKMGFSSTQGEAKRKPDLIYKLSEVTFEQTKEKHSCRVDNWMKVIFSDESRICSDQGDNAGIFMWCHRNESYKEYQKFSSGIANKSN